MNQRPSSFQGTTHLGVNFLGLFTYLVAIVFAYINDQRITMVEISAIIVAAALPSALYEWLKVCRNPLPRPEETFQQRLPRLVIKMTGISGVILLIGLLYWVFPEYHKTFYNPFWDMMLHCSLWLAVISPFYVFLTDKRMNQPEDGAWHFGRMLLGHGSNADGRAAWEFLKSWLVKAFFLPLMTTYLSYNSNALMAISVDSWDTTTLYAHANTILFTIDLVFAATGYAMTLRLLNTQIQSSEPTVLGWGACLLCYSPFWEQLGEPSYFDYDDHIGWLRYVDTHPIFGYIWCALIVICLVVYAISTVSFGIRFSNLTYRGLICNGMYRFSKHPAYISKNLSWWLISIPFIASNGDIALAVRNCVMLAGVNAIYFLRARTEENHLSNYPEYVAYAQHINEYGVLRFLGKWFPALRYSAERAQRSGSVIYVPKASLSC